MYHDFIINMKEGGHFDEQGIITSVKQLQKNLNEPKLKPTRTNQEQILKKGNKNETEIKQKRNENKRNKNWKWTRWNKA